MPDIQQLSARQIQIELVQRAIVAGAVAMKAHADALAFIERKQAARFAELARQTVAIERQAPRSTLNSPTLNSPQ